MQLLAVLISCDISCKNLKVRAKGQYKPSKSKLTSDVAGFSLGALPHLFLHISGKCHGSNVPQYLALVMCWVFLVL